MYNVVVANLALSEGTEETAFSNSTRVLLSSAVNTYNSISIKNTLNYVHRQSLIITSYMYL